MKNLFLLLSALLLLNIAYSQPIKVGDNPGIKASVLSSTSSVTRIQYDFGGFYSEDFKINNYVYANISSPGLNSLMKKGYPQLPSYSNSIVIPDLSAINYKIISREYYEIRTKTVMPSKGHFTRDIDPNSVPWTFNEIYNSDTWYPENNIELKDPYIIRDLRGMTIQFNPVQYNPAKGILRIYNKFIIEVYNDNSKPPVNPFKRLFPLNKVSSEFAGIYRQLFMNYGMGNLKYDSISEPGKMLFICPTNYMSAIQPLVQWKQQRGLNVTVAEYPTQTGTGNTAIKTYIQNMYNSPGSVTYIILVGDVADMPTLSGVYESAPSDPCYVKLAGTDAYPDAFISRISCQTAASVSYVAQKFIKFERDIEFGAPWYNQGTGIGGPDVGGTPPYADSVRMNWIRDTLMAHGFTLVDKINGPVATPQDLINALNQGRYVLNYVGHGSGTSWSNTGFSVTNSYQLANGWKEPFLVDVACLNGNFTLNECLAESLLRAGDTANPKGCSSIYASSTNASWVPPCDMQTHSMYLLAHQYRKSAGAIAFFGVMKAMDMWGGSTGEGLKLMEQYNLFGDCSLLLTRGVPLGPSVSHSQLPNTENLSGPYVINCIINTANAPLKPNMTKLFWTRTSVFADSIIMINSSGNNWTANIPGNGSPAIYKYYIKTIDTMNRIGIAPGGAPANYYSFTAASDTVKPVITHTPIQNTPKALWPITLTANVTDNIGVDSAWVKWRKNSGVTKQFKLLNTSGSTYSAMFNSINAEVVPGDIIYYKIFARDNSLNHNTDSSAQYNFTIINLTNICIGTGAVQMGSSSGPFNTYWWGNRTQMLWTASEITNAGGSEGFLSRLGFNIATVGGQAMNGFNINIQHTTQTTLSGFVQTGWTNVYSGTYTVPGTGWQFIDLQTYFNWNGTSNLLVEICFGNTSWSTATVVNGTTISGMTYTEYHDISTACTTFLSPTAQTSRPNLCFVISPVLGINSSNETIPTTYSLKQNYPNPFNPVTRISFDIPKQGLVSIKIYDVLGREVKTLVNEIKSAGRYSVDFDASELSSGVYFYRLTSGSFTDVKRMLLIK